MKIIRLDLRAIGPFTDRTLDLSNGAEGLHLIYGDNERGKTSALRAIGDMFFGIPAQSSDNFIHHHKLMRVGGTITARNGEQLEFTRRKGNKNTLLAADGETAMDEGQLRRFIGDCDRQRFETTFGINHQALVKGGQEIINGEGEVGPLLFAAGAGIAGLRSISVAIKKDADSRFTPSSRTLKINKLLADLEEAKDSTNSRVLHVRDWAERKKAKDLDENKLREVNEKYQHTVRQLNRLQRIRNALPAVAVWKQLREQLKNHAETVRLSPGFASCRRDTVAAMKASQDSLIEIDQEIARIDQEMIGHMLPESLLMTAKQIEGLRESLGQYRKAQRDRDTIVTDENNERAIAGQILNDLRPDLDIVDANKLRLSKQQKANIQLLSRQYEAFQREEKSAKDEIAFKESRKAELGEENSPPPDDRDPALLSDSITAVRSEGQLERQAAKLKAEIAKTQRQIEIECSSLGLVSGGFDALEGLPLPSIETVELYDRTFSDHDAAITVARDAAKRAQIEQAALERQLDQLRSGDLPTEADLVDARALRDRGWQLVLADWQGRSRNSDSERQFLETMGHNGPFAEAFQRSFLRADELVDLLRHESKRVAARDLKAIELADAKTRSAESASHLSELLDDRDRSQSDWQTCWQPATICPRTPREMKDWLQRRQLIVKLGQTLRGLQAELNECESWIAAQRNVLLQQLAVLDVLPAPTTSLQGLLVAAQTTFDRLQERARIKRDVVLELDQIDRDLLAARKKAAQAERELLVWRSQWAAAVQPLGLGADASGEIVTSFVLQLDDLFTHLIAADKLKTRIEGIDHDGRHFRQEVERLLLAIEPERDLTELNHERAVNDLFARLQQAIADKQAVEQLELGRNRLLEKRGATATANNRLQLTLQELCREAGCKTFEELPAVEQQAEDAAKLKAKLESCEAELHRLGDGASITEIVAEVDEAAAEEIAAELDRLGRDIVELQSSRDDLHQKIGGAKEALSSMDCSAAAAEAAQREQETLAQIDTEVAQYLRLRLASAVLSESIERYRKKNEEPVLTRASALFTRLTLNSFDGLEIDLDENKIVGVRGANRISPEAMSEGSCDQLYLALRLASLETWIESHEPMPFIVDDILVSFDNDRSKAALEVLAELSKKTQVIFFAHHRHLVAIAKEAAPKGTLFVHEL